MILWYLMWLQMMENVVDCRQMFISNNDIVMYIINISRKVVKKTKLIIKLRDEMKWLERKMTRNECEIFVLKSFDYLMFDGELNLNVYFHFIARNGTKFSTLNFFDWSPRIDYYFVVRSIFNSRSWFSAKKFSHATLSDFDKRKIYFIWITNY